MKCNYHTHTFRCHHAIGEDRDYVEAAIEAGFDVLGFADHAPWPYRSGFISNMRMTMDEFPAYLSSIRQLRDDYRGQIEIHVGLESEFYPGYEDHLHRLLDSGDVEYLILGAHFHGSDECTPYIAPLCKEDDGIKLYTENCLKAIDSGMFRYIAHPDLFMRWRGDAFNEAGRDAARQIAEAARSKGMPLEYNLLGLLTQINGKECGYPCADFWSYVRPYAGDAIIGVDAHDPLHLTHPTTWSTATAYLNELGYHVVDHLTF